MSAKRPATTELNHENWDQDDPDEHEEMGTFKIATKEAIEKRVIRTAKRRAPAPTDGPKTSVFSGFGGFTKTQPSSFDFLANLTNGSKPTNGSPSSKTDTGVSSSGFNTSPATSNAGGGLFSMSGSTSSTTAAKSFVMPTSQSSSLFGGMSTTSSSSLFTSSKADSTVGNFSFKPQTTSSSDTPKTEPTSVVSSSSTMFGIPANNTEAKKSLFSTAATSSPSPFKTQSLSSQNTLASTTSVASKADNKTEDKSEESDKKLRYYTKLKGLNESVSDWIKQHVEKTPLCILSPIFKDYEKHLKEIQEEYQGSDSDNAAKKHSDSSKPTIESKPEQTSVKSSPFTANSSSLFSNTNLMKTNTTSPFSTSPSSLGDKVGNTSASSASSPPKPSFSFGINTSPSSATPTTSAAPASAPFSFGIGKPFSINNFNAPKPTEAENNGEEADDEPPKVEYTPVVEKDSVYEKKCKIFVKKDGNYADKGVGTLYVKKIEASGKYQLLVRANTNLGNVMLNLILASAIPTQRMGKNNVMMVCIPTPEAEPPPTSILIRVKTAEEADELLETLNKYKM